MRKRSKADRATEDVKKRVRALDWLVMPSSSPAEESLYAGSGQKCVHEPRRGTIGSLGTPTPSINTPGASGLSVQYPATRVQTGPPPRPRLPPTRAQAPLLCSARRIAAWVSRGPPKVQRLPFAGQRSCVRPPRNTIRSAMRGPPMTSIPLLSPPYRAHRRRHPRPSMSLPASASHIIVCRGLTSGYPRRLVRHARC